jgi:hypothetical protein
MLPTSCVRVLAAVLVLLSLAACKAGMVANKHWPGVLKGASFQPAMPPAAEFGPNPELTCPKAGAGGQVVDLLQREAGRNNPVAAQPDGRLCAMADTLLGW